jgi:hypothetical protein
MLSLLCVSTSLVRVRHGAPRPPPSTLQAPCSAVFDEDEMADETGSGALMRTLR